MREVHPFMPDDLAELDERLLSRADACVALREVFAGNRNFRIIQMRHDVDNANGAFEAALRVAEWEAERGYRSTYYMLHTADYWHKDEFNGGVRAIARLGHEVGLHVDALGFCAAYGGDPQQVLQAALLELRSCGVPIRSVAGHGNPLGSAFGFANDEQFVECRSGRERFGDATRDIETEVGVMRIRPQRLRYYGLDFEAVRLGRAYQLSDSGGGWPIMPFSTAVARFPDHLGQLHFLWHPDWWTQAL